MLDSVGIRLDVLVLVMVVIPLVLAVLFGWIEFRIRTPLVFHCRRCAREFCQPAHRDFPSVCPLCRARDWNA